MKALGGSVDQPVLRSNVFKHLHAFLFARSVERIGEIMGVIQRHHAKLYYAGMNANWPPADYELTEIQGNLDDAMQFYPVQFKEVGEPLPELIPARTKGSIDQVREAIEQKNERAFVRAYQALSASCSSCHAAANNPFIRIQTPRRECSAIKTSHRDVRWKIPGK